MTLKSSQAASSGEHPLMSNKTLRAIYAAMANARTGTATGQKSDLRKSALQRASRADVACYASPLVGLEVQDLVFDCRANSTVKLLRRKANELPIFPGAIERLHAAIGAALALRPKRASASAFRSVVLVYFDRHELTARGWKQALKLAADLPILLVVLPRWKGSESDVDICRESREAGIPGIPVDADDAIALYRVAQESLIRARADATAALIEAVRLATSEAIHPDPIPRLAAYLLQRGIADQAWIERIAANTIRQRKR